MRLRPLLWEVLVIFIVAFFIFISVPMHIWRAWNKSPTGILWVYEALIYRCLFFCQSAVVLQLHPAMRKHLEIKFPTHHENPALQFLNKAESALSGRSQQKIPPVLLFRLVVFGEMIHQIPLRVITAFQTWEDCLTFSQLERLLSFRDVNTSMHTFSSSAPYSTLSPVFEWHSHGIHSGDSQQRKEPRTIMFSSFFFFIEKGPH